MLNAKDWKPIRRQMDFGTQANPDLVTSTITPVNQYFHETYGPAGKGYGKTGLNSMSSAGRLTQGRDEELENKRTTNLAHTELRRGGLAGPQGEVLFAAFRSGALSGKDLPGNANDQATHDNTMELLQAMTIEHLKRLTPGQLQTALAGALQHISVTSISLQSGGLGNERRQIDQQLRTLDSFNTRKRHIDVWWTMPGQQPTKHTVTVRFHVIGLNLGVNAQGFTSFNTTVEPALAQLDVAVQSYLDMSAQVLKGKHNAKAVIQAGPSNNLAQAAALAAALQGVNMEIDTIEAKNAQIEVLWAAIRDMKGTTGTYKMAGRIANLSFLIGHMVHFNCKSGKDRTGLMDAESKHLALRMDQTSRAGGRVTREGIRHTLTDEGDQDSYQKMLFESGNLQMQEYNTGGQGYKIAPAVGIFPADTELMRRVGGEAVLTQLQGLKRYTDIDQI